MIRLIALDMDGTLLGDDHMVIPQRNVEALRAARAKGIKIMLASGRSWNLLSNAVKQLGEIDYALTGNGSAVLEVATGKWLWERCIPNAQALRIIDLLHAEGILFEVYCEGQNFVRATDREGVICRNMSARFGAFHDSVTTYVDDLARALAGRDVEKFNLFYVPPEGRDALAAKVMDTGPLEQASALPTNMEFSAKGVNKGTALKALTEQLGLSPGEVMAFGDGENDADMLAFAGWSFAMEGAVERAKAAAKYIAPANVDSGVGQMVEKCILH